MEDLHYQFAAVHTFTAVLWAANKNREEERQQTHSERQTAAAV